ncbi:MAG: UvrD-helicase domain-containing protein [Gammaproteobacteria bacterium]|nr:UvrD-helicase domain-containing protein [Gammaproteobacteria bacterium]MBU1732791.1 UvrD-helicase domain-containing protein [Gammaproteobacteria bacterium]MBU1891616.1 UvrD-helicase domain-containing protein [Gammaproteobacteria bacterium]
MNDSFDFRTALDPSRSVVIEACAGSGKTWLLVSRILRLLLAGAKPGEILAITFTRKAAQEMQARLLEWLNVLALRPEDEVREFLRQRALDAHEIDAILPEARNLLERVLTAEPALTINTFHGWFLQLLQRAPLGEGSVGNFSLLDQTAALQEEAWQNFAEDLAAQADGDPAAAALQALFREYGLANTRTLLLGFVAKRAEWWAYTAGEADPVAYAVERVRIELDVDPEQDVLAELWLDTVLAGWLVEYASILGENSPTDQKLAMQLVDSLALENAHQRFEQIWAVCFTKTGTPRARNPSSTQAKRLGADKEMRLFEFHQQLCFALYEAHDRLAAQAAYRFNRDGLLCGAALLAAYQRLKEARQMLDFADVEWRVFQLLSRSEDAEYMQYKLDSRYKHILLDEFQDTNPLQWQVMQSWLSAYGAAGNRPSVFLVGDPKQSIYRFRRAEPRLFQIAAEDLARDFAVARLEQDTSRRSAPAVITAVNRVFAEQPDFSGFREHACHHEDLPGAIALMPLAEKNLASAGSEGGLVLRNPLLQPREEDEDVRHEQEAEQVAEQISAMVGKSQIMDEKTGPRPAEYRDFMLLVRGRTWLASYERKLRAARIPYLSSRQGGLLDTLECSDLVALLEFLVTPFADLKLAQVLRSPIFGCSDGDLMLLATPTSPNLPLSPARSVPAESGSTAARSGEAGEEPLVSPLTRGEQGGLGLSWWQRLRQLDGEILSPSLQQARALLRSWQALADRLPVHDLLDRIYFEGNVLARYLAAVPEAMAGAVQANLRAFIELALNMDSGRYPSLARFINEVAALRRAPGQESPDEGLIGDGGNAVRILTVHGAKGLEAPIVWLLDANTAPRNDGGYRVLLNWPPQAPAPQYFALLSHKAELARAHERHVNEELEHARRENLNLLYVAMTRARQMFIVSGCAGRASETWYQHIHRNLAEAGLPEELPAGPFDAPDLPLPLVEEQPRLLPVPPTGRRETVRLDAARLYGIRVHALLEWLRPELPLEGQAESMRAKLALDEDSFAPLWRSALDVLEAPELRHFYDPAQYLAAYNELGYQGADGELRRLDRLVEFADSVWVLDYKTGASGGNPEDLAAPYLGQMREYRDAMGSVFPGKAIHCALIFPGPVLVEV